MKIIFLEAVQTYGGARKSTVELASRLLQKHDIIIVDAWGCCEEFVNDVKIKNIPLEILHQSDVAVTLEASNIIAKFFKTISFVKEHFYLKNLLNNIIKDQFPDVIIVNNPKTLSLISNSKNFKTIFFAREWMVPQSIKRRNRLLFKNKVDNFICVAQATRHALYCGNLAKLKDIYVVPNAISTEALIKKNGDRLVLMHCGGFLRSKGQLTVVEIAKKLKLKVPDFKIYMIGIIYTSQKSKLFLEELRGIIIANDLGDNIEIIVDAKDMNYYYQETKILLHPSDTEGLPRVVMEAMSRGVAVIANPVGGVNDFILDGFTGYLANFNDVDNYIQKIMELHNDNMLLSNMTQNAYNLIKNNYTSDLQVLKFEDSIKSIINNL